MKVLKLLAIVIHSFAFFVVALHDVKWAKWTIRGIRWPGLAANPGDDI
jgi:hypothetical protein